MVCYTVESMGLEPLGNILKHHKTHSIFKRKVEAALIVEYTKQLLEHDFGKASLQFLTSMSYTNKVLRIKATSAPFKQEIALRERAYKQAINDRFGAETVEKLAYF